MPQPLRIYGLAIQEQMRPGIVERLQGSERYIIMFFHSEALIATNGERGDRGDGKICPAHSLIVWPPGRAQAYGHPTEVWNHSWIVLDGAQVARLLRDEKIPLGTVLAGVDASIVEHYLLSIHRELAGRDRPDSVIVKNILQNWLREIQRGGAGGGQIRSIPRKYAAIKRELEAQFDRPTDLNSLARKAHVSRWHLCREFKRHFGLSPIDCLLRNRMQHAANLLREPNLNVSEIARQVGYEDAFHFSKLFKKHYGLSPRKMRQEI
jgi:AraC family transcriptional regulator of arabinose operon